MAKKTWKKYQVFTVVVTVLIVLGSGGLSYWIYDLYKQTLDEESNLQDQIAIAKVKRDKVPGLEQEVIRLRENVKEYVKILPDTNEVNEFVKKLSDFANQSGVDLVSLKDDTRSNKQRKKQVFDKEAFRIELVGNIFQYLKFISLIENYERFVKISDVTLKAGEFGEDMLRHEVVHSISMLVETFVYHANEGIGGKTRIQNYEKKKEKLADLIKVGIPEIKIDRYEYVYDPSLRDPFVDPRSWVSGEEVPEGLDVKEQEKFITDVLIKIEEVRGLLDRVKGAENIPLIRVLEIRKEVAEQIITLNQQINQAMEERWITHKPLVTKMDTEILPALNLLTRKNVDGGRTVVAISAQDLEETLKSMKDAFEVDNFDKCMEDFLLLKNTSGDQLSQAASMDKEIGRILSQMEELYTQATVSKEFQSIPLKISGIISQNRRSVVIVNGKVLSEGQCLQESLFVEKIEDNTVYFKFKNQIFQIRP